MTVSGQRVVIIGGTSGIGRAVANAAVDAGAVVHIGARDGAKLASVLDQLGGGATGDIIDVNNSESVAHFFANAGSIDHLVFTAGDWVRRRTMLGPKFDGTDARAAFDTRFWGAVQCINAALPMLAPTASITLTAGVLAHRPQKGQAMSTALAGAVEHLTQGLAVDLAPVRVNCVTPGLIATEAWAALPPETMAAMTASQPIARPGAAEEVAAAYLYFMQASYTTGQSAVVDGGRMLQ